MVLIDMIKLNPYSPIVTLNFYASLLLDFLLKSETVHRITTNFFVR